MSKVFIYRNLHKKGVVYSVKDLKLNRVVNWVNEIYLKNVELKVSQKGRERVLLNKQKNVHAGVKGEIIELKELPNECMWIAATYNPYKYEGFVERKTGKIIKEAQFAMLNANGLYVILNKEVEKEVDNGK